MEISTRNRRVFHGGNPVSRNRGLNGKIKSNGNYAPIPGRYTGQ